MLSILLVKETHSLFLRSGETTMEEEVVASKGEFELADDGGRVGGGLDGRV